MGDPKRIRNKYDTPSHPWIKSRIDEEKRLSKDFGTKSKKEIWKADTLLKNFKTQAKKLIALTGKQTEIETQHLFRRVKELGLIEGEVTFDAILGLQADDILQRRLQSIMVKKELARSSNQARQFIVHGHVLVNNKKITSPSYLVSVAEEGSVSFSVGSSLFSEEHPERHTVKDAAVTKTKTVSKEEEKVEEKAEEKSTSAEEKKVEKKEEKKEEKKGKEGDAA